MVSYDYYVNTYLGSAVPEKLFSGMAVRAEAELAWLERIYSVTGGEDSRKMAICAMAECLLEHAKRVRGISAAAVSTTRYNSAQEPLERQLYRCAGIYLDICRGVS